MAEQDEIIDATSSLRRAAELSRVTRALRRAFLETNQREFLARFDSYRGKTGPLSSPDPDAIAAGFRLAWAAKDLAAILEVGARLPSEFLARHREIQSYYFVSRNRVSRP